MESPPGKYTCSKVDNLSSLVISQMLHQQQPLTAGKAPVRATMSSGEEALAKQRAMQMQQSQQNEERQEQLREQQEYV